MQGYRYSRFRRKPGLYTELNNTYNIIILVEL